MPRADGIIDWKIDCYVILFFDYQTVVVQLNMMGKRKGCSVEYCRHVDATAHQLVNKSLVMGCTYGKLPVRHLFITCPYCFFCSKDFAFNK